MVTVPPVGVQHVGRPDRPGARGAVRDGRGPLEPGHLPGLFLSPMTVEAYARSLFTKLMPDVSPNDNRRLLAVLALLRG